LLQDEQVVDEDTSAEEITQNENKEVDDMW